MKGINEAFERQYFQVQLDKLLEAMSPEDQHDTDLIRSIQNKIAKRSNAALTPEEQAVLKKYNIIRHDKTLAVSSETDPNGWYTRSQIRTPEKESPYSGKNYQSIGNKPNEVNLADIARKRGARLDRDVLMKDKYGKPIIVVGTSQRGVKHDDDSRGFSYNRLDRERDAQAAIMQNDVLNMSQALRDRKYHKKEVDRVDAIHDRRARDIEIDYASKKADNERSREFNRQYHDRNLNDANNRIDALLKRKNESMSPEEYNQYLDSPIYRCARYCDDVSEQIDAIIKLIDEDKLPLSASKKFSDKLMYIYGELEELLSEIK